MPSASAFIFRICALSVILGFLSALRPSERLSPQLKLLTSSVLLIAILSPLFSSFRSIPEFAFSPDSDPSPPELSSAVSDEVCRIAESELENSLRQMLAQNAVPISSLTVTMNTSPDGCINIQCVTLTGTKPQDAQRLVSDALGKDVPVYADESF